MLDAPGARRALRAGERSPRSTSPRRSPRSAARARSAGSTGWWSAPERVLAVDFKSNRVVPAAPEAAPEAILRQMGAYRAALGAIWPGRRVETAVALDPQPAG